MEGINNPNYRHGKLHTKLYNSWRGMKDRCSNPKHKYSKSYIEKGITICEEWRNDFRVFLTWAESNQYKEGLTIDRIDNSLGYCPSNCRWVTNADNCRNKDNNKLTWDDIRDIRDNVLNLSAKKQAMKYKVSDVWIYKIRNGKVWVIDE